MATRLINIPQLDIGAKKALRTHQNIQSGDYAEINITLYENGQPKPFAPDAQFAAYGLLYKSKEEIIPIPNENFKIIDAEKGQFCLFLTPVTTQRDDVLMIQVSVSDNGSSIEGHSHYTTHFCTQYFLITIQKSQCPGGDIDQIYKLLCSDDDYFMITDDGYLIEI